LFWGFLILENQQTSGFGLFENFQNCGTSSSSCLKKISNLKTKLDSGCLNFFVEFQEKRSIPVV